jgi:hypothetical protein
MKKYRYWRGGGKPPPKVVILDPGTTIGRYTTGTPLFERGDWVLWTAPWPKSAGNSPLVSRAARVSKVTQDRPWGPHVYHIRLHEPVEYPGARRWAYTARLQELRPMSAVDFLAVLGGNLE